MLDTEMTLSMFLLQPDSGMIGRMKALRPLVGCQFYGRCGENHLPIHQKGTHTSTRRAK